MKTPISSYPICLTRYRTYRASHFGELRMGMLGIANSATGQRDWHNILGGVEFASDFTKIIETVGGFEELIRFLEQSRELKAKALALGEERRW